MIFRALTALLLLSAIVTSRASAHDWWLEAATSSTPVGSEVAVTATVGVAFQGDRVTRDPRRIRRFVALDAQGEQAVGGEPGSDPLGRFVVRAEGTTTLVFESEPARLFLRAPEFERYLKEEGLDAIVAQRAQRGESQKMGLEQYTRCAKALVRTPGAPLLDRAVGLPLELVALGDLAPLAAGGKLALTVQWRQTPLAGVNVVALERDHRDAPITACSDEHGRVELALPHGGFWLVKCVHMAPAPAETRLDWESFWASLTFEVPGMASVTGGAAAR